MGLVLGGPGLPWAAPSRGFNLLSKRQKQHWKEKQSIAYSVPSTPSCIRNKATKISMWGDRVVTNDMVVKRERERERDQIM